MSSTRDNVERAAFIHREIVQLGVLIGVACAAFFLTQLVASKTRATSLRDAAEWYRRGEQAMEAGRVDDAIAAFRRAGVRNRTDARYDLALARALVRSGDGEAARSVLLALREAAPENPDINLQLAEVAVARQDVTEAIRFYHNALYAPWSSDQAEARRRVRLALIRFLLVHDQRERAVSELLALTSDLPDDAPHHLDVAHLFAQADDNRHALDQFQAALHVAPDDGDALAGAGLTAFALGDYQLARQYLHRVPADSDEMRRAIEVVDVVLSSDPLATRIGSAERRRRLLVDLSYAKDRLNSCLEEAPAAPPTADQLALQHDAQAFERQITPAALEQDTVEAGLDLVDRMERDVMRRCGPPTARDQALVLIGRQHGASSQ